MRYNLITIGTKIEGSLTGTTDTNEKIRLLDIIGPQQGLENVCFVWNEILILWKTADNLKN